MSFLAPLVAEGGGAAAAEGGAAAGGAGAAAGGGRLGSFLGGAKKMLPFNMGGGSEKDKPTEPNRIDPMAVYAAGNQVMHGRGY